MSYIDLLNKEEWFERCNDILQRDKFCCQDCGQIGYHNMNCDIELESLDELSNLLDNNNLLDISVAEIFDKINNFHHPKDTLKVIPSKLLKEKPDCKVYSFLPGGGTHFFKNPLFQEEVVFSSEIDMDEERACDAFYFRFGRIRIFEFQSNLVQNCRLNIYRNISGHYFGSKCNYILYYFFTITYKNVIVSIRSNKEIKPLNIHHLYYVKNYKPWEYDDNALITLCADCHKKRHKTNVPIYNSVSMTNLIGYAKICPKCKGLGFIPEYAHVENGICFMCGGEGVVIE